MRDGHDDDVVPFQQIIYMIGKALQVGAADIEFPNGIALGIFGNPGDDFHYIITKRPPKPNRAPS